MEFVVCDLEAALRHGTQACVRSAPQFVAVCQIPFGLLAGEAAGWVPF